MGVSEVRRSTLPIPGAQPSTEGFAQRHGPVLNRIGAAKNVADWGGITQTADYIEFLVELQGVVAFDPEAQRPETQALLKLILERTGMTNPRLWSDLGTHPANEARSGKFLPQPIQVQKKAGAGAKGIKREELDRLGQLLYDMSFMTLGDIAKWAAKKVGGDFQPKAGMWSWKLVPGVKEFDLNGNLPLPGGRHLPLQIGGKNPIGWAATAVSQVALPVVDTAGEIVGGALDAAAFPFDAATTALSTDLQAQYRAMRHQLSALSLTSLGSNHKVSKLAKLTEEEKRMALLTASVFGDVFLDVDKMCDVLRDPKLKDKPGALGWLQKQLRFTTESLAELLQFTADVTRGLTDEDHWRKFHLNFVVGGGIQVLAGKYPTTVGAGVGIFTPSISELELSNELKVRTDFSWPSIGCPHFGAFPDSRGGKYTVKPIIPGLSASNAAYSKKVGFGIPFVGGVKLSVDKLYGPGLEVQAFVPKLSLGVARVVGGGSIMIFHGGLAFVVPFVGWSGDHLSEAVDSISDFTDEVLMKRGLQPAWRKVKSLFTGKAEKAPPTDLKEIEDKRLHHARSTLRHARAVLEEVDYYKDALAAWKHGESPASRNPEVFARMSAGFGAEKGREVIEAYLARTEKILTAEIESIERLTKRPEGVGWLDEIRLRHKIRKMSDKLFENLMMFDFANRLLMPLLGSNAAAELRAKDASAAA